MWSAHARQAKVHNENNGMIQACILELFALVLMRQKVKMCLYGVVQYKPLQCI